MALAQLTLVLHGLVALVPSANPDGTMNHMTALLVDARTPMAQVSCASEHHAELVFVAADITKCIDAGCEPSGQQCTCGDSVLAGKEVTLSFQTQSAPAKHPAVPAVSPSGVPAKPESASDFGFVLNLSRAPFSASLDPAFLAPSPPAALLARMVFDFESIAACGLFSREDGGLPRVHAMVSRKLGALGTPDEPNQAVAQMVVARLPVPTDSAGNSQVTLHLHPFAGGSDQDFVLLSSSQGAKEYRVDFANDTIPLRRDDPCDDGIARHVAHYYDLATNPPAWPDRQVPHMKFTVSTPMPDVTPKQDDPCSLPNFHLNNRPACPLVSFNAVQVQTQPGQ